MVDQLEGGKGVVLVVGLRRRAVEELACRHIRGGGHFDGLVALSVAGEGANPPRADRQRKLGAVEHLELGLLVEAEANHVVSRAQVEADCVAQLLAERKVARDVAGVDAPKHYPVALPGARHGAQALGRRACRPIGRAVWRRPFERHPHHFGTRTSDLLGLVARALGGHAHTVDALFFEPLPPPAYGVREDARVRSHRFLGFAGAGPQNGRGLGSRRLGWRHQAPRRRAPRAARRSRPRVQKPPPACCCPSYPDCFSGSPLGRALQN